MKEHNYKGEIISFGVPGSWFRTLLVSAEEPVNIGDWVYKKVKGEAPNLFRLTSEVYSQLPDIKKIIASAPQLEGTFNLSPKKDQDVLYSYVSPDKIRITYDD